MLEIGQKHVEIGEPQGQRVLRQLEIAVNAEHVFQLKRQRSTLTRERTADVSRTFFIVS